MRLGVVKDISAAAAFGKSTDIGRHDNRGTVVGCWGVDNVGAGEHGWGREMGMLGDRGGRRGAFEDGAGGGKHGGE